MPVEGSVKNRIGCPNTNAVILSDPEHREGESKDLRLHFAVRALQLAFLILLLWAPRCWGAPKIKDADCLTCHGDSTLTTEVNGKQVSLFVDRDKLKHSFHGRLFGCVDCH